MGMSNTDRAVQLFRELMGRGPDRALQPRSMKGLCRSMDCSRATVKRALENLRETGHDIPFHAETNGYYIEASSEHAMQAIPMQFSGAELRALLAMHELLSRLEPDLSDRFTAPVKELVERELGRDRTQVDRIRILGIGSRDTPEDTFETLAEATMERRRVNITYHARGKDQQTRRDVSPQRLVSYRGAWYLDAWCHMREDLRMFSLDCILDYSVLEEAATDVDDEQLDDHVKSTYGIFPGAVTGTALLRFNPHRARWVESELWHPEQKGQRLEDGSYQLEVPYGRSEELMMDILKYGPDVEVIGPPELRELVAARLREASGSYSAG